MRPDRALAGYGPVAKVDINDSPGSRVKRVVVNGIRRRRLASRHARLESQAKENCPELRQRPMLHEEVKVLVACKGLIQLPITLPMTGKGALPVRNFRQILCKFELRIQRDE